MNQTRHRYIVVGNSPRRTSKAAEILLYFLMFILGLAYFVGFFWYGTQELDSERQTGSPVERENENRNIQIKRQRTRQAQTVSA